MSDTFKDLRFDDAMYGSQNQIKNYAFLDRRRTDVFGAGSRTDLKSEKSNSKMVAWGA